MITAPRKLRNQFPIPGDQRLFLGAGPALDLPLDGECIIARTEILRPDQLYRKPLGSVPSQGTALVLGNSALKIVGVSGIIAAVIASKEISVKGHMRTLPFSRGLRQAQAERGGVREIGLSGTVLAWPSTGSG